MADEADFGEPGTGLKAFRHFVFKIKELPDDTKAAATAQYIDAINDHELFLRYFALSLLMFQSHSVNANLTNQLKDIMKKIDTTGAYSSDSKVTLASVFDIIFGVSKTSQVEAVLKGCTKIDAKFIKRLACGKIEKNNLMPLSAYLKELGLSKHYRKQVQQSLDSPEELTHEHLKSFAETVAQARQPFYYESVMASKRAKNFNKTHITNTSEDWMVCWKASNTDQNMAFFRKLNQSGANFTNIPSSEVTHLVLDKDTDMINLADGNQFSHDCDFIFI